MDVTIFFNTKRKFFLAIGQLIFVGLGGLLLFYPEALISVVVRNETFIRIVGTVSLTYFSFVFLLSLKVSSEVLDSVLGGVTWVAILAVVQLMIIMGVKSLVNKKL